MHQPLTGITVVDLTRALSGPTCTAMLGDMGARIIKIETGEFGDSTRRWPPYAADGKSLYFESVNRNKESLHLNLRSDDGKQVLRDLLGQADVLVENFRPGVLAKMGFAPDDLRRDFPDLVIASISGFGPVGPLAEAGGLDQVAQGMSGLMSVTGAGDQTPMRVGVPIVDSVSGIMTAFGIASALYGRAAGGGGTHVQGSLLETGISLLSFQAEDHLVNGTVPSPAGNHHPSIAPYGAFKTADSAVIIACGSQEMWHRLTRILGRPELAERPEFAQPGPRHANHLELAKELEELLVAKTTEAWIPIIRAARIPCGPIHALDKVFTDPQVKALGMVEQPGEHPVVRGPLWADGVPTPVRSAPPGLGADTESVLRSVGYDAERVAGLLATDGASE